jgi:hypothetical protein
MLNTIDRLVHEVAPEARIVRPHHEPVVGAVLLALEAIGVSVDEALQQALDESLLSVRQIRITNLLDESS